MRNARRIAGHVLLQAVAIGLFLGNSSAAFAQASTPQAFDCQPSTPNHVAPPKALEHYIYPGSAFYGGGIWATIPLDGRMLIGPANVVTDSGEFAGWRTMKMPWTRDDGVVGPLIVTGERLDGEAPSAVDTAFDRQYGSSGFTPVVVAFASAGCWQITGAVGNHINTFTLEVIFTDVDPYATPAG